MLKQRADERIQPLQALCLPFCGAILPLQAILGLGPAAPEQAGGAAQGAGTRRGAVVTSTRRRRGAEKAGGGAGPGSAGKGAEGGGKKRAKKDAGENGAQPAKRQRPAGADGGATGNGGAAAVDLVTPEGSFGSCEPAGAAVRSALDQPEAPARGAKAQKRQLPPVKKKRNSAERDAAEAEAAPPRSAQKCPAAGAGGEKAKGAAKRPLQPPGELSSPPRPATEQQVQAETGHGKALGGRAPPSSRRISRGEAGGSAGADDAPTEAGGAAREGARRREHKPPAAPWWVAAATTPTTTK